MFLMKNLQKYKEIYVWSIWKKPVMIPEIISENNYQAVDSSKIDTTDLCNSYRQV